MNALIVDDENDIALIVSRILTKRGLTVKYLDRITKARKEISCHTYDLFLLDLNLPDGTGFDLIPLIRENNEKARIFIISAYDGITEMKKAKEMNISAFIKNNIEYLQLEFVKKNFNKIFFFF